ncbi:MAG: RNA methyltransferase [Bacteroidales bacterium]|jgi:tRNA (guanosine-2'-O-)-methyltransferase|nr:RNA methyltransferase [Bacteroidales bacterium]
MFILPDIFKHQIEEDAKVREDLIRYLSSFLELARWQRLQQVAAARTRHVTVLVEDLYQMQNCSAVLRTCECYGLQNIHVVARKNEFQVHKAISMGADKWLSINYYHSDEDVREGILLLKKQGYRVVATLPGEHHVCLDDLPVEQPSVFLFGTELHGLSPDLIHIADTPMKIPMYGFTESFNISNSVAIVLSTFVEKLRKSSYSWQLSPKEQEFLLIEWLQKSVKHADFLINKFFQENIAQFKK